VIAEDDPLVEIQTDKTTVEIPSPASGLVAKIHVAEGEVVPVGTVLVEIGDGAPADASDQPRAAEAPPKEAAAADGSAVAAARPARVQATPLVRRIAQELAVDLAGVAPTGPGGRITEDDVRAAAGGRDGPPEPGDRREKLRGVRRRIVEHLTVAHREVPAVTYVEECDFTGVDTKQIVPLTLRAVADTLPDYPELNARLEGGEIVYLERYDIGIAVQTGQGLVVPVVRDCGAQTVEELDLEVRRLAESARAGTLAPEELRDSTFSVTSAGKLAGLFVTPLINHPEVAILGVHRIGERPVVRDGAVVIRRMGNVSVTFDHRVIDGARAAEFTLAVISSLENPKAG
jgi:pyruvate/2-oxoglutarate dehydrogenase complex dihydrolipoamide acyltransferase (E2) component